MNPKQPSSASAGRFSAGRFTAGRAVLACAAVLFLTALSSAAGVLTLRHLGALLGAVSPALGRIFSALRGAEIRPVPWASLLAAAAAVFCGMRVKRGRGMLWILPAAIFVLTAVFTAVLSARVNGIVFFDVLRPLAKTALGGGLDALMG